ncbi:MAG: ABC transporter permease [Solirubrobacterales bacterium]
MDPAITTQTTKATDVQATGQPRRVRVVDLGYRFALVLAWIALIVVFGLLEPDTFLTASNFQTIFGSQAVLLILTLGLIVPLSAGEYDLSVAGMLGLSLVLMGWLNVTVGLPIYLAIMLALAAGVMAGLINAFFVVVVGVESLVVTLGMGTLLTGIAVGVQNSTLSGIDHGFVDLARTQFLGVQLAFWFGLALTVLIWYVYSYTPLGRYLYFVGAGPEVARLTGVRVKAIRAGSLVFSGFLAALAGVVLAGTLGGSDPTVGPSYLLPAFAAAFLGATAITPGRFNPWGSFVSVYFLVTGITGLQLVGAIGWVEQFFYGFSLIVAVTFSKLVGRARTGG